MDTNDWDETDVEKSYTNLSQYGNICNLFKLEF